MSTFVEDGDKSYLGHHTVSISKFSSHKNPVRKNLGIPRAFPIIIYHYYYGKSFQQREKDNVIAALGHPDRVREVSFHIQGPRLGKLATAMQEPFPVLTNLYISAWDGITPILPGRFLGRYAPCLWQINLRGVPFPALPTLLLSTHDLVSLILHKIPPTGYISPQAMLTGLAALPRLETLMIIFLFATPSPHRIRPAPPITRIVLSALTCFEFEGASEYLEDLVANIDSPRLDNIRIAYLNQLVDFQVVQLSKFIHRSVGLKSSSLRRAQVVFFRKNVYFNLWPHVNYPRSKVYRGSNLITIKCEGIDWQVSHMAQVLSHIPATLSNVAHLEFDGFQSSVMDEVECLHLLHQFSNVQTLRVSKALARHVALALEDLTEEMVAEVLPSLDLIYLGGQPASSTERFVAVRRLSGRHVTSFDKETAFDEMLKSHVSE